MRRAFLFAVAALGAAGLLAPGCIFVVGPSGPRVTYGDALIELPYQGGGLAIQVAAQDRREYVLSGQTEPEYVGQARSRWGIPHHRHTESGRPLAADLGQAAAEALRRAGFLVAQVELQPKEPEVIALSRLRQGEAARSVFLVIHEWMYDRYRGYTNLLTYKLEAQVLDSAGQRLASVVREAERQIDRPAVLEYADILADLLTDPELVSALEAR
ncbi:MAG TPA: hypothetical protein PK668_14340 [Myxococcota bacterium]|nr:hypothetical protein [Myxococcota bacterium]HRY93958.1 hypothetical protein [Myxococcota bacterium]HSA23890.1 hypothetical protein [Myxococcota bacterium]